MQTLLLLEVFLLVVSTFSTCSISICSTSSSNTSRHYLVAYYVETTLLLKVLLSVLVTLYIAEFNWMTQFLVVFLQAVVLELPLLGGRSCRCRS